MHPHTHSHILHACVVAYFPCTVLFNILRIEGDAAIYNGERCMYCMCRLTCLGCGRKRAVQLEAGTTTMRTARCRRGKGLVHHVQALNFMVCTPVCGSASMLHVYMSVCMYECANGLCARTIGMHECMFACINESSHISAAVCALCLP